jgi:uridine kinase
LVQVAGGSASGKTSTVSKKIVEAFGNNAVLVSMDDYYKGKIFKEEETAKGRKINWDQPRALHMDLLEKHLSELKQNKIIKKPIFDFKKGDPSGFEKIVPKKVIVVEGLFALNNLLKKYGDIKVFVDIGVHGRVMRKLLRDIERTGQTPKDLLKYFSEFVQPMHSKYVQSTKKYADVIIKNEYNPKIESERTGFHEIQLKFRGALDQEFLRKLELKN